MVKVKTGALVAIALAASLPALPAAAIPYVVQALGNSSSGGVGLPTIPLVSGQGFTTSASTTDLWSAGALPRWSDANGLTANRFATGSDESGQPSGTLIGQDFGLWTQNSLSAPYGSPVGEIGGVYHILGAAFSGPAWASGILDLYYWDSNNADNTQFITVAVSPTAVPEPSTLALLGTGLLALVSGRRRGQKSQIKSR
jgi:hypothetical protein